MSNKRKKYSAEFKAKVALATFKHQYARVETCIALTDVLTRKDIARIVISSPAETISVLRTKRC